LARLLPELAQSGAVCTSQADSLMACMVGDGLHFTVQERVESMFLAHTVCCEFRLQVPLAPALAALPPARMVIRHSGMLRRQGIACIVEGSREEAVLDMARRLETDPLVISALLPLDFRRCELHLAEDCWQLRIEHFGASELVTTMPPMRRYIRLVSEQRTAMLRSLLACQILLAA
jgi:hypothetical protein